MVIDAYGNEANVCATPMTYARVIYAGNAIGIAKLPNITPHTEARADASIANGIGIIASTFAGNATSDSCPS